LNCSINRKTISCIEFGTILTGEWKTLKEVQVILFAVSGRLHFINVQMEDSLLSIEADLMSKEIIYTCIVFNQFLRTTASGDDQRIVPLSRPRECIIVRLY
jgi:hypothetical protein